MFAIPTLRGEGFFLALNGLGLAVSIAITAVPPAVAPLALAAVCGMASGVTYLLAISRLPRQLTNATADLPARRRAFLASLPGKLHEGIDGLALLLFCASSFWQPHRPPLPAFAVYGVARFAVGLVSLLAAARKRRP